MNVVATKVELQELIWIDIHRDCDVFRHLQLVERFANQPAQAHDGGASQENVKTILSRQFFQRRGRGFGHHEFFRQRFAEFPAECFRGKFPALLMRRMNCYEHCMLEWWKIAALAKFQFLLDVAREIVMARKLDRGRKRGLALYENFSGRLAAAGASRYLGK